MSAASASSKSAQAVRQPNLQSPVVAIIGATGAVGAEMVRCLEKRRFPLSSLRLFASARSAGQRVDYAGQSLVIEELREEALTGIDIALFAAGGAISRRFAPALAAAGTIVIDNSSAFRMQPDVPLVVPEINAHAIDGHRGIIANPNCATVLTITPLWPIHRVNPLQRLIISTYQAASGAGAAAMEELRESTRAYLAGEKYEPKVLPHPYAFNVFSHNTRIDPATGYNEEETKVMQEARKIFAEPSLRISATCIRVPVLRAHCISATFECARPITPAEVREIIAGAPGVKIVDDIENNYFPMPKDASGQDELLVGRIRQDLSDPEGRSISLFIAGDQLLKGAALNAVQIAELVVASAAKAKGQAA
ncbi:MAG: aspartate-semialdehyde dehydrogenase [Gammaproteobacteria bacterium]|nr:aspartate-semialdehyde dehydrogenase [Gammaproteobacteria bacterium]